MKAESYILANTNVLNTAIIRIKALPLDGTKRLIISDAGSKSDKQRALNWLWNTEVSQSGIGGKHEDTKNGVHLVAKYRWAVPILVRDDPFFADLWGTWFKMYSNQPERVEWFVDTQVHTEKMTASQAAEYLTEFQRYYMSHGVQLTDPDDLKLLAYEGMV